MIPPPTWTPTAAEYHADPRWSTTGIRLAMSDPGLAFERYILKSGEPDKPTAPMILGTAIGATLFGRFDLECAVAEVASRNAKEYRAVVASNPGKTVLTIPEREQAQAIARAIMEPQTASARAANRLLFEFPGHCEYAATWDDESGVPCRLMVDRLIDLGSTRAVVELKSSSELDPHRLKWKIRDMGYDVQGGINLRGLSAVLGEAVAFFWVFVGTEPPHEVAVYRMSPETTERATSEAERHMLHLAALLQDQRREAWAHPWERLPGGIIPTI